MHIFYFQIIAVAISQGETKLKQLQVSVTDYNVNAPAFEHDVYRGELHVRAKVGTSVLRIHAKDEDPIPYNAEVKNNILLKLYITNSLLHFKHMNQFIK